MNKEQKKLLLRERSELKESSGRNPVLVVIGLIFVVIAFMFGYRSGFIILSLELIVGITLIVWGLSDKESKRIKEIDYLLAGDEAKEVKTTHKVRKYFCAKCGNEVKETDSKCKKCKSLLAVDGALKIKDVNVNDKV